MKVKLYDTTLRDGSQAEGISFSVEDKLKIARRLDEAGFHYVEGGWPGSNPKDADFFEQAAQVKWKHAKIAAFGMTRRRDRKASEDESVVMLVNSKAPVVTLVAKTWDFHVAHAIRVSLEENLRMIEDSVGYVKSAGREVIFDAEHFFDGFRSNPEYAIKALRAAQDAGADLLCLCDTNGGRLPSEIAGILDAVKKQVSLPLGIHAHNDSELAAANSIIAVQHGAVQVQGTINGYGERCGNANLCSIAAILNLKLGLRCLSEAHLQELRHVSLFVSEVANLIPNDRQPFVGRSAFAHKGGMHVDAVMKHPDTYEHIKPELIGNERRVLVSDLSGTSNISFKAQDFGFDLEKASPETKQILKHVKALENEGYEFEGAEASLELLMKKATGKYQKLFDVLGFRVIVEGRDENKLVTEATLKLVVHGEEVHTVAEGDGPVHALDGALRKAIARYYPSLSKIRLTDFKVRVVNVREGTAAKVRVLVETTDDQKTWNTVGVSTNIIEASWHALLEGVEYGLMRRK